MKIARKSTLALALSAFALLLLCALPHTAFADVAKGPYLLSDATETDATYVGTGDAGYLEVSGNITIVGLSGSGDATVVKVPGSHKITLESTEVIPITTISTSVLASTPSELGLHRR